MTKPSKNFDSVETEATGITGAGSGTTTQMGPTARDEHSLPPFPSDWTKQDSAIITGTSATNNQAGYPTLFHASEYLDSPIDDWYLYWAGHDSGGIRLHTAPDLSGPWSSQGQVLDVSDTSFDVDVSSPDAVPDPDKNRVNLYAHGEDSATSPNAQRTRLYTAPFSSNAADASDFTEQGLVLDPPRNGNWDDNERSYLTVTRAGGLWFGVYNGRDQARNNKGLGYCWSQDGSAGSWSTLDWPWTHNHHLTDVVAYGAHVDFQSPTPKIVEWGGQLFMLMALGRHDKGNRHLYVSRFEGPNQRTASPKTLLTPSESWEYDNLESPRSVIDGTTAYLFYNSLDSSTNERSIGYATADLGGY